MLAKPENIRGGHRVTKGVNFVGNNDRRNRIDEAYTGNRPAHREARILLKSCIWTAPKLLSVKVETLTSDRKPHRHPRYGKWVSASPGSKDRGMVEEKRKV